MKNWCPVETLGFSVGLFLGVMFSRDDKTTTDYVKKQNTKVHQIQTVTNNKDKKKEGR